MPERQNNVLDLKKLRHSNATWRLARSVRRAGKLRRQKAGITAFKRLVPQAELTASTVGRSWSYTSDYAE